MMMNPRKPKRWLWAAPLVLTTVACSGTTPFTSAQPVAIVATPLPPPPPPPPPPAPPPEPPKPPPRVVLRDNKIEITEKIQFDLDKATIKPESDSLLHDIAEVIKQNPQVLKLSIEGHASAEGPAKHNKVLSEDRAKSVMDHLVKKDGIEADRLSAKGWGIEKPIAPNDTEENREKNRRVEFLVTKQDVTRQKVEIDATTGKERVVDSNTHTVEKTSEPPPADDKATDKPKDKAHPKAKPKTEPKTEPKKAGGTK